MIPPTDPRLSIFGAYLMTTSTLTLPVNIDTHSGKLVANSTKPFIVTLKLGENLFEGLLRVAQDAQLAAASFSGIGALENAKLAYYYLDKKEYKTKLYNGIYELVSLDGNITYFDGKPFLHIHCSLGEEDFNVIGGHLMDAMVGPSAEITVIPLSGKIERKHDDHIGLKLMCPIK
jgi:predicted DNA-binding protein with PD1-like motif